MKYCLLSIGLLILFTACDSWLDVSSENTLATDEAFSTQANLEQALTGVYSLIKGEDLAGRNWLLFSDLIGGNVSLLQGNFAEITQLEISVHNTRVEGLWSSSYRVINQLNQVLAAINMVAQSDPFFTIADQEQLRGEAYLLRAIVYDYLLRYFALPYTLETADSLGVPLVLEPIQDQEELVFPARTTVRKITDQIQQDLQSARELLPAQSTPGRVNTYVATAYLAKLMFHQERWREAADLCQEIIDGPYSLTDIPQGFFRQEGSTEEIWAAKAAADNPNFTGLNWAYTLSQTTSDLITNTFQALLLPAQTMALEGAGYHAIDLRVDTGFLSTDPLLSTDQQYSYKYEDYTDLGDDAPLLRLAEFLLLRAEALVHLEEITEALELLNCIRRRAFRIIDVNGNLLPTSAAGTWVDVEEGGLSTEELLAVITRERRAELAFEGNLLHDRIRRQEVVRGGLTWNDPRLRLPIPQREIDANPNLVQNPGY
ncbi:MAG: RagB/SusD family nutrient uptake outer membrane protein [Bacteroidota bacterium]